MGGGVQVEVGQWTSDILAEARGARLHALAAANASGSGLDALVIPANSKITSPEQLRGRSVLVNVMGGLAEMLSASVLEGFQVQPSQTHYVVDPFPKIASALQRGDAAAAMLPEPFLTQAEENLGMNVLVDLNQGAVADFPLAGYVAASSWVRKNPRVATAFVSALIKGQAQAATDRAAVEQVLPQYVGITKVSASLVALGSYPINLQPAQLDRVGLLMRQFGMLGSSVNVDTLIHQMMTG